MNADLPLEEHEDAPQPRLRVSVLVVGACLLMGLAWLVLYGYTLLPWLLPAFPEATLSAPVEPPLGLPEEFTRASLPAPTIVAVADTPPKAPIVPTPHTQPPVTAPSWMETLHTLTGSPWSPPSPPPSVVPTPPQTPVVPQTKTVAPERPARTAVPPAAPAQKKGWGLLVVAAAGAPQAAVPPGPGGPEAPADHPLIHHARWAIPAEPAKTLYRSQTIPGRLLQALQSDLPGQVLVEVTVPIFSKDGQRELIPKGSLIIAQQIDIPRHGETRLGLRLDQIELPDGSIVELRATIGDERGTNGLTAQVNNHYGKLLAAAGISAILNIGVNQAVGTPGQGEFFRSAVQDAAQDVGQSVQRSAQGIVDRSLRIPPTLTRKALTFCTINLLENITFTRPPVLVR